MRHAPLRILITTLLALLILAVASGGLLYTFRDSSIVRFYSERISLALDPSAAKAYALGSAHLDSNDPAMYNIDHAEYFFRETIRLDYEYPSAHHQLARVHFLRGNIVPALTEIEKEIELHGETNKRAYYVRGLIRAFAGAYSHAAEDFALFVEYKSDSWPAHNDLAWTLLKAGRPAEAAAALENILPMYPDNAWLLNSYAIALFELGRKDEAAQVAVRARAAVLLLQKEEWARVNPGNDPRTIGEGLETFKRATVANLEAILAGTKPVQE